MASKNKGPGGMRILWIPGRKKQHNKGEYKPTKTQMPNYGSKLQSNRNEMWSLGGPRGQRDLINADAPHDMVLSTTSHAVTESIGLAAAAGGVVSTSQAEPVQPLHEVISVECEDKQDLDSIEALDDTNQLDQKSDFDSMDGVSLSNNEASMKKLRKRSRTRKQNGNATYDGDDATTIDYDDAKKSETNEKLVTCLYYSMMCCECSIS